MKSIIRRFLLFFILVSLLTALGCKKSKPKHDIETFPAAGVVFYQGKPAYGAEVVLHPVGASAGKALRPSGIADKDGHFKLNTYGGDDGAPAGDYAVTVTWPGPSPANAPGDPGPDRLNGRYMNPAQSTLRVQIKSSPTELAPIQLQ